MMSSSSLCVKKFALVLWKAVVVELVESSCGEMTFEWLLPLLRPRLRSRRVDFFNCDDPSLVWRWLEKWRKKLVTPLFGAELLPLLLLWSSTNSILLQSTLQLRWRFSYICRCKIRRQTDLLKGCGIQVKSAPLSSFVVVTTNEIFICIGCHLLEVFRPDWKIQILQLFEMFGPIFRTVRQLGKAKICK